jgi:hypothetical protein
MLKGVLFYKLENITARVIAPFLRSTGQAVFHRGQQFQGQLQNDDRLVPSLRCIPISDGKYPKLLDVSFIL